MKALAISAHVWGMTNTWTGHAYVDPQGHACPVNIKPAGPGKFSSGSNRITTENYPNGVYRVDVDTGDIEITYFPPEGGEEKIQPVLAPEPVQRFASIFVEEANCYHCKCLQEHLDTASELAQDKRTPLIKA